MGLEMWLLHPSGERVCPSPQCCTGETLQTAHGLRCAHVGTRGAEMCLAAPEGSQQTWDWFMDPSGLPSSYTILFSALETATTRSINKASFPV